MGAVGCDGGPQGLALLSVWVDHRYRHLHGSPFVTMDQHSAQPVLSTVSMGIAGDKNVVADALSRRSDNEAAHAEEAAARLRAGEMEAVRPRLRLEVDAM